ncbi:hypothetical protein GC163_15855 [bacterium]|nr:hypothetical protein [bacterium]
MNLSSLLGRSLGTSDVTQIDHWRLAFGASWAHSSPALVLFAGLATAAATAWFYFRLQNVTRPSLRLLLVSLRTLSLFLLILILADPILEITFVRYPPPVLWVGLDGSDSMAIADELPAEERQELDRVTGRTSQGDSQTSLPTRADDVRAFLTTNQAAWLTELSQRFQIQLFALSTERGVESLLSQTDDQATATPPFPAAIARWSTTGQVTALGESLEDLSRRQAGEQLAGVVLFSDFDQNSGPEPIASAQRLGVPIFTVGVGPESAVDVSVDLLAPPTMKQAETSTLSVTVRQRELDQTQVVVRVWAEPLGMTDAVPIPVGEQTVLLTAATQTVEFSFTPEVTGRYVFVAEVAPVPGESVTQNNTSRRDVRIIDDFLRLLYVEYEPTWEWRFIKEVFHRDKLVGTRGFRTFLRSADPIVRESNELFVSNLTLPRHEFFSADVIFLGDLPASALSTRFGEMTKEFVDQFGGGLVVLAGPRFGPGQLAETPLADMLPVIVDPNARLRDRRPFAIQLTPLADQYDFMHLGATDATSPQPWSNLNKMPWYQPVQRVDPRATVLAEHPVDVCADGQTKQPLIAIRPYGRGEVVYVAFNELWRLRRLHGEEYYRQFWGQLIHRLGLSHALGDQKRFVVRTDRRQYRSGDDVLITVEAYDEDFNPLNDAMIPDHQLQAEWQTPVVNDDGERTSRFAIRQLRPGVFESRLTVSQDGEYRLRVTDPITQVPSEIAIQVSDLSIERRNPVRNVGLQSELAQATGGRSYELTTLSNFLTDFQPPRPRETSLEIVSLWDTWLTFVVVIALMMTEWFLRKMVHLP